MMFKFAPILSMNVVRMYLQHLLSRVWAILHHHQHSLFLYQLLYHRIYDFLHLSSLLLRIDHPTLKVHGDQAARQRLNANSDLLFFVFVLGFLFFECFEGVLQDFLVEFMRNRHVFVLFLLLYLQLFFLR